MDVTCGGYSRAPAWEILLGCRFSRLLLRQLSKVSLETFGFPRQREKHHKAEGTTSLLLSQKARAGYRGGHTRRHTAINLAYNTATANLLSLKESYF